MTNYRRKLLPESLRYLETPRVNYFSAYVEVKPDVEVSEAGQALYTQRNRPIVTNGELHRLRPQEILALENEPWVARIDVMKPLAEAAKGL